MRIKRWLIFVAVVATGSVFGWSYLRGAAPPQYQTAPVIRGDVDATVAARSREISRPSMRTSTPKCPRDNWWL